MRMGVQHKCQNGFSAVSKYISILVLFYSLIINFGGLVKIQREIPLERSNYNAFSIYDIKLLHSSCYYNGIIFTVYICDMFDIYK